MERLIYDLHARLDALRADLANANAIIAAQDAAAVEWSYAVQHLQAQLDASRAAHAECLAQLNAARAELDTRGGWKIGTLIQPN